MPYHIIIIPYHIISFCSSLYGAELWDLSRCDFDCITVAWRKALKRVWSLPWRTHSNILYSLCNKWPIGEEIYRRALLFGIRCINSETRCINSETSVVRYVSSFGIKYGMMHSVLGRNILSGCQRYGIKVLDYFCMGQFSFRGGSFQKLYTNMNYSNNDVDFYAIN